MAAGQLLPHPFPVTEQSMATTMEAASASRAGPLAAELLAKEPMAGPAEPRSRVQMSTEAADTPEPQRLEP